MSRKAKGWGRSVFPALRTAFNYKSHDRMFQQRSPGGGENWLQLRVNAKGPKGPSTVTGGNTSSSLLCKPTDTQGKISTSMLYVDVKEQATVFTRVTKSCLKIKIKFFQS